MSKKKNSDLTTHQYAHKYRLYPTEKQKEYIEKHFGCTRFVYNWGLSLKRKIYEECGATVTKVHLQEILTKYLKNEYPWLKEVDSISLISSLKNLDTAYKNFFEGGGYPNWKDKHKGSRSYQFHQNYSFHVDDDKNEGWLSPPKFSRFSVNSGLVDSDKIKMISHDRRNKHQRENGYKNKHHPKTAKSKTVTISRTPSGEYFASILFEWVTKRKYRYEYTPSDVIIGVDLGIKDFLITSEGEKYNLDDNIYSVTDRFNRIKRKLSRKRIRSNDWKNSNRYKKLKRKKAKYERKIARIREQNHYDIIHSIINKHKPKVIAVETLKIKNMVKNKRLSKAISSQGWGMFIEKLQHKCDERGITLIKIDQWFASSQLCSSCGHKNEKVKDLSVREWLCSNCGTEHDRDINSAKNIREKAKLILDTDE